jgi:acyl-CoA hydrolase
MQIVFPVNAINTEPYHARQSSLKVRVEIMAVSSPSDSRKAPTLDFLFFLK